MTERNWNKLTKKDFVSFGQHTTIKITAVHRTGQNVMYLEGKDKSTNERVVLDYTQREAVMGYYPLHADASGYVEQVA